jgi:hypothetical protein
MVQLARLALFGSSIGILGCSEPATLIGNACKPGVTPTVSQSAPAEFQWTPACDVGTVVVTSEAGHPMWQVSSDPQADFTPTNEIHSGLVYGVAPPKTHAFIDATALVPGQVYRVALIVTDSRGNDTGVGNTTFSAPAE